MDGDCLLVIGNGFDIHCGMKTHYSDFFEHEMELSNSAYQRMYSRLVGAEGNGESVLKDSDFSQTFFLDENFTVWDAFFLLDHWLNSESKAMPSRVQDRSWCDVEEAIRSSLLGFHRTINWSNVLAIMEGYGAGAGDDYSQRIVAKMLLDSGLLAPKPEKENDDFFWLVLSDQLHLFEKRFSNYVLSEEQRIDFQKCALSLVNKLTNNDSRFVDSFNYSQIQYQSLHARNLHGIADNYKGVIFGISDEGIVDNEANNKILFRFTKSFRTAAMPSEINLNRYENIKEIVFYGSSLSEQDYYYFYRLFDNCGLRKKSIKSLTFAYSPKNPNDVLESESRCHDDAIRLIRAYDKKYTGSNTLLDDLQFFGVLHYKIID